MKKQKKKLCKNPVKGIFFGVCQGLGDFFGITAWIFRVIFLIPMLPLIPISGGLSLLVYIVLAFALPDCRKVTQPDDNVVEVEFEVLDEDEK